MAEALILSFDGVGEEDYWAVNKQLGVDMRTGEGDWPAGLLTHAGGLADNGKLVVVEVWASREDQATFMQTRLGPALGAAGVTAQPDVQWVSVAGYQNLAG